MFCVLQAERWKAPIINKVALQNFLMDRRVVVSEIDIPAQIILRYFWNVFAHKWPENTKTNLKWYWKWLT
ncbi:MAG TPA: hypothetical protein DDZ97_05795, partial [Deltaproteobacteria bacterium]|nr:hypothetical protein [Deltaproteobacteria bacterium]